MECLIIGLGVFGRSLAKNLKKQNVNIVGLDLDDKVLKETEIYLDQPLRTDATVEDNLRLLGIDNFDYTFVTIGTDMEASLTVTLHLKNLGAKKIIARANSPQHALILEHIGATKVVSPEIETGERLAEEITTSFETILTFSNNFSVIQTEVPFQMIGKNLKDTDLRKKYNITILTIRSEEPYVDIEGEEVVEEVEMIPDPEYKFKKFDKIFVIGKMSNIKNFLDDYSRKPYAS